MRDLLEERIGTNVADLDLHLAEYMAMTEIERWAQRTLVPRDRWG